MCTYYYCVGLVPHNIDDRTQHNVESPEESNVRYATLVNHSGERKKKGSNVSRVKRNRLV